MALSLSFQGLLTPLSSALSSVSAGAGRALWRRTKATRANDNPVARQQTTKASQSNGVLCQASLDGAAANARANAILRDCAAMAASAGPAAILGHKQPPAATSSPSFFENNYGFDARELLRKEGPSPPPPRGLLSSLLWLRPPAWRVQLQQIRGFKSRRSQDGGAPFQVCAFVELVLDISGYFMSQIHVYSGADLTDV